jgi:Coiled-coil protein 142
MLLEQGKVYFQESCLSQYKLFKIGTSSTDKNVERSLRKVLLNRKALLMRTNLRRRHFQLLFIMSKTIKQMLFNGIFEAALHLASLFNNILLLNSQYTKLSSGSLVISNTFPTLFINPKRMDITSILQLITKYRTESCCASLISCLLANCRAEAQYDDNESDTSSLLIFHALTKELSHSEEFMQQHSIGQVVESSVKKEIKLCSTAQKPATVEASCIDDPAIDFFDRMTSEGNGRNIDDNFIRNISEDNDESQLLIELIRAEEIFIAHIIAKCLKFCPSAFEGEINKSEVMRLIEKASRFLWTHVSGTLEHFVLWWNAAPLACRPVGCTKYLREWLLMQSDEAPEPILSTLKSLGEILTIHVIGCLWDKQFRNCLVLSSVHPDQTFDRNSEFFAPPGGQVNFPLWSR